MTSSVDTVYIHAYLFQTHTLPDKSTDLQAIPHVFSLMQLLLLDFTVYNDTSAGCIGSHVLLLLLLLLQLLESLH